jgi:ribosomal protein S18 acetylase RimI-like enzyme
VVAGGGGGGDVSLRKGPAYPLRSSPVKRLLYAAWRTLVGLTRPSPRGNLRRLLRRGEALDDLTIREATPADIPELAALHVTTWNATYAPFGLKGPSVEVRKRQWRAKFSLNDPDWFCLVVQRADGELVGFAQANRSDNPAYEGELAKIHLRRDYQRVGLGRRLVGRVAKRFLSRGIRSMWLFGDVRNPSSRAWISMGATKCDADPGSGNFGWGDIRPLAKFAE